LIIGASPVSVCATGWQQDGHLAVKTLAPAFCRSWFRGRNGGEAGELDKIGSSRGPRNQDWDCVCCFNTVGWTSPRASNLLSRGNSQKIYRQQEISDGSDSSMSCLY